MSQTKHFMYWLIQKLLNNKLNWAKKLQWYKNRVFNWCMRQCADSEGKCNFINLYTQLHEKCHHKIKWNYINFPEAYVWVVYYANYKSQKNHKLVEFSWNISKKIPNRINNCTLVRSLYYLASTGWKNASFELNWHITSFCRYFTYVEMLWKEVKF